VRIADVRVARSAGRADGRATGARLTGEYLEFLAGRCRPNNGAGGRIRLDGVLPGGGQAAILVGSLVAGPFVGAAPQLAFWAITRVIAQSGVAFRPRSGQVSRRRRARAEPGRM